MKVSPLLIENLIASMPPSAHVSTYIASELGRIDDLRRRRLDLVTALELTEELHKKKIAEINQDLMNLAGECKHEDRTYYHPGQYGRGCYVCNICNNEFTK